MLNSTRSVILLFLLPLILAGTASALIYIWSLNSLRSEYEMRSYKDAQDSEVLTEAAQLGELMAKVHRLATNTLEAAKSKEMTDVQLYMVHAKLVDDLAVLNNKVKLLVENPQVLEASVQEARGLHNDALQYANFVMMATEMAVVDPTTAFKHLTQAQMSFFSFSEYANHIAAILGNQAKQRNIESSLKSKEFFYTVLTLSLAAMLCILLIATFIARKLTLQLSNVAEALRALTLNTGFAAPVFHKLEGMRTSGFSQIKEMAQAVFTFHEALISRKQAERELALANAEKDKHTAEIEAKEKRFHALFDSIIDSIIVIDANGIMQTLNPAAIKLFGYKVTEVQGKNIKMMMPEPYASEHDSYLHNFHTTHIKKVIGIGREVSGKRKDGSTFPIELSVTEIEVDGEHMYTGIVRDITERKRNDQLKTEFVSTVSHELRTPLTAISGSLGLIMGGVLGEIPLQAKTMIALAHKNSLRLTLLVNDLLDMEKLAEGKVSFDMQLHSLTPLIRQALEENQNYGVERRVQLVMSELEVGDALVRVDVQRLMQIMSNLLSNAIKYSPADGIVSICVQSSNQSVRVTISDRGPGIPAEFSSRIFQKFNQADSSDTRQKGGTGLGLAITKELVERMDGKIGFDSIEGQGASFYFELPLIFEQA